MNRPPKTAQYVVNDWLRRYPGADEAALTDGMYRWQLNILRSVLSLTDMALEDEGVPAEVRERVLRACMLGSAPQPVEAQERRRAEMERLEQLRTPPPNLDELKERFLAAQATGQARVIPHTTPAKHYRIEPLTLDQLRELFTTWRQADTPTQEA